MTNFENTNNTSNKISLKNLKDLSAEKVGQISLNVKTEIGNEMTIYIDEIFTREKINDTMAELVTEIQVAFESLAKNKELSDEEKQSSLNERISMMLFPILFKNFTNLEVTTEEDITKRNKDYLSFMSYLVSIKCKSGRSLFETIINAIPKQELDKIVASLLEVTEMIKEMTTEGDNENGEDKLQ